MSTYKGHIIRERQRRGRPKEAGGDHIEWTEVQVVQGRRVLARFDLESQAIRWIDERTA